MEIRRLIMTSYGVYLFYFILFFISLLGAFKDQKWVNQPQGTGLYKHPFIYVFTSDKLGAIGHQLMTPTATNDADLMSHENRADIRLLVWSTEP